MPEEEGIMFNPVEVGDFDDAVEKANKQLIPAVYRVRIEKAKHGQGDKAQYINWQLNTLDCPDPEDNDFTLFHITPIEGRGFRIFTDFCQALGVRWEGGSVTPDFIQSCYGLELNVETSIEEYEDKPQTRVKKVVAAIAAV